MARFNFGAYVRCRHMPDAEWRTGRYICTEMGLHNPRHWVICDGEQRPLWFLECEPDPL